MSVRLIEPRDYPSAEQLRKLMQTARQERAAAVSELFGFGFSALRSVVQLRPASEKGAVFTDAVGKGA